MIFDRLIFNKTKAMFGGQTTVMLSGVHHCYHIHVENFLKVISCTPLIEAYVQKESTGPSFVTSAHDPHCGHVGGPTVTNN
jgi:long-chain acyl-CoA synthetase